MQPATRPSGNRLLDHYSEYGAQSRIDHENRMLEVMRASKGVSDDQWRRLVMADKNENQPLITMNPLIWKGLFEREIVSKYT